MVTPARMVALLPIDARASTSVGTSVQSASVCRLPSALTARGCRSLVNITPWPTNTPSSMRHALADERVARDLAVVADHRVALDLDERADRVCVADPAAVEVDERRLRNRHVRSKFHIWSAIIEAPFCSGEHARRDAVARGHSARRACGRTRRHSGIVPAASRVRDRRCRSRAAPTAPRTDRRASEGRRCGPSWRRGCRPRSNSSPGSSHSFGITRSTEPWPVKRPRSRSSIRVLMPAQ